MALFKKEDDPIAAAQADVDTLMKREIALDERLQGAEHKLEEVTEGRRSLFASDFTDAELTRANAEVERRQADVRGLGAAVADVRARREAAEHRLAEEKDRVHRARAVAALEQICEQIMRAAEDYQIAGSKLAIALSQSTIVGQGLAGALSQHIANMSGESSSLVRELRSRRDGVANGAPLPRFANPPANESEAA